MKMCVEMCGNVGVQGWTHGPGPGLPGRHAVPRVVRIALGSPSPF